MKKIKDFSILTGDEKLLLRSEWIEFSEINTQFKILKHQMFDKCFDKIVENHEVKNNVAFLSLCTKSRPFNLSRKWKTFIQSFGKDVDYIVYSSAGIIPQAFWASYPFLNYSGTLNTLAKDLSQRRMEERLNYFFENFQYEYVIFNIGPKKRNYPIAKRVLSELKERNLIKDFVVIPDMKLYNKVRNDGFSGCGHRYPDIHRFNISEMENMLRQWSATHRRTC